MIKVVNRHTHKGPEKGELDIYIGRGTIWGNPYSGTASLDFEENSSVIKVENREEAIDKYKQHIYNQLKDKNTDLYKSFRELKILSENYTVNLVCSCKPKSCHGDVIKEIINRWIQAEKDITANIITEE